MSTPPSHFTISIPFKEQHSMFVACDIIKNHPDRLILGTPRKVKIKNGVKTMYLRSAAIFLTYMVALVTSFHVVGVCRMIWRGQVEGTFLFFEATTYISVVKVV
jgi:hypothetical protein